MSDPSNKQGRQSVKEIVGLVFKNPPLLLLILAETFRNTYILVISAFAFYYFEYVLKNMAFLSVFILAISIARLIGTFAASWIGVREGIRSIMSFTPTVVCILSAVIFHFGYEIEDKTILQMEEEIAVRKI